MDGRSGWRVVTQEPMRQLRLLGQRRMQRHEDGRELTDEKVQEEWEAIEDAKQSDERAMTRGQRQAFIDQRDRVAERLDELGLRAQNSDWVREDGVWRREETVLTADAVFDLQQAIEDHVGVLDETLMETLETAFETGALRIEYEGSFNADRPAVQRLVGQLNGQMRDVSTNTRRILNRVILAGQEDPSKSTRDIADDIVARLDDMAHGSDASSATGGRAQSRARRVAATTTTTAFNGGQEQAWREAGVLGSTWMSQRDARVSEGHFEADGQSRELGSTFEVRRHLTKPLEEMRFPGDPEASASNVVNCRCDRLPILTRQELEQELQNQPELMA